MSILILYFSGIIFTMPGRCQNVPILYLLTSYKIAIKHNLLRQEAYHIIFLGKSSDKCLGSNSAFNEDSISLKTLWKMQLWAYYNGD